MARNYIDVPILVVKLRAKDTCTTGALLKGSDTAGWQDATALDCCCGAYALETFDTAALTVNSYGSAMLVGTFYASHATTSNAGWPFIWNAAAGSIDSVADSMAHSMGTVIDHVAAATTRTTRVLIYGTPIQPRVW
jgi:hypothetical protein